MTFLAAELKLTQFNLAEHSQSLCKHIDINIDVWSIVFYDLPATV